MKKLIASAIIILFIGLAIAPSINANVSKASIDSELVEITTEVCGINGVKPNTVSLSKEDAEEVEKLIDDIERRLDNVETREETVEIFNEAVVELDKYGLLGGLSVKQAQRLVTGGYQNPRVTKVLEKMCSRNEGLFDDNENKLCLIAGDTAYTTYIGMPTHIIMKLLPYINEKIESSEGMYQVFLKLLKSFLLILSDLTFIISNVNPITIGNTIYLGFWLKGYWHAIGWVFTLGVNGIKFWQGDLWGNLPNGTIGYGTIWSSPISLYPGVSGFSGIKVGFGLTSSNFNFYLGTALHVKIKVGSIP